MLPGRLPPKPRPGTPPTTEMQSTRFDITEFDGIKKLFGKRRSRRARCRRSRSRKPTGHRIGRTTTTMDDGPRAEKNPQFTGPVDRYAFGWGENSSSGRANGKIAHAVAVEIAPCQGSAQPLVAFNIK